MLHLILVLMMDVYILHVLDLIYFLYILVFDPLVLVDIKIPLQLNLLNNLVLVLS